VVPRLLPYAVPDFTGRRGEVDRLLALALGPGGARARPLVISAIDGMAGVGKTALALHVGHALAGRFPDGQLFVDLRGFTPGQQPLDPGAALAGLLRAVGVSETALPSRTEERAQLWRSRAAGKRYLMVLDNAVDAEQVRPLIPGGPRSLVLVTSRRRMPALDGAVGLPLDVLGHDEAVELFTRIAGPDRVAGHATTVDEIVALCGRLPLALRIAAARLAHHPAWTPVELLQRLRRPRKLSTELSNHEQSVAAAFAESHHALTPAQRRAFRLAALHPGEDVTPHALAALVDSPPDETEDLLESLHDHHLLIEHTAFRYTFHDLLRTFAGERLEEALEHHREALEHQRHSGNRLGQAIALNQFGEHQQKLRRHPEALDLYQEALDLHRDLGDTFGQAESHTLLGDALLALDAPESALRHYRAAIEFLPHTGERYNLGRIHLGLARAHQRLGATDTARRHAEQAVEIHTSLDVPETDEARALLDSLTE
jgi:tetratricopeptide (TPR) repeat protein